MAAETSTINPYTFLHIVQNPDGSLTRLDPRPNVLSTAPVNETELGLFKDVTLDEEKGTSLRLFLPLDQTPTKKLPIIVFYHGGGFILQSPAAKSFHDLCMSMAAQLTVVVVSVNYRLAPEHRLPAGYEDAADALLWVQKQASGAHADPWISSYADVSKSYIMGISSGGNMAYHTALRALDLKLKPMKVIGLITSQPFFGGVERTESELKLINDKVLPLAAADLMWDLSLPVGANRDHVYSNFETHEPHDSKIHHLTSCLLRAYEGDPLVDRHRMFEKMLDARGVHVVPVFREGGVHAAEVFDPTKVQFLLDDLKAFFSSVEAERGRHNHGKCPHQHEGEDSCVAREMA